MKKEKMKMLKVDEETHSIIKKYASLTRKSIQDTLKSIADVLKIEIKELENYLKN